MTSAIGSVGSGPGIDPAQLKEMRDKLFNKLDANGDGTIDQAELDKAKQAGGAKGHGHHHGKGPDLMKLADADGDGKITKDELMSAFDKMDQQMKSSLIEAQGQNGGPDPAKLQQKREQLFDKLDANGDGTIDQSEIDAAEKAAESKGPGHGRGLDKLLQNADADGDGTVTKDELLSAFDKIDEKLKAGRAAANDEQGPPAPPVADGVAGGLGGQLQAFLTGLLQSGKSTTDTTA